MDGPNRWAVLSGAWAVYAAFGLLVSSTGALVPDIQADLGLSGAEMGAVLGAWQLVFVLSAIPGGRMIDRFGARRALSAAMVVILASGLARAAATGRFTLFAAVALLGVGGPIVSVGVPKVAASLFDGRDRRLAVAVYSTAPGIGSVLGLGLPANVIGPLVDQDWRATMVVVTMLAASALVVWAVTARRLDTVLVPGDGPGLSEYRSIAGLPVVRFVLAVSVLNFFFIHGIGQWLVGILVGAGWTVQQAGLWAAFGTAGGLVGSFAFPRLATPSRRPYLMIGSLILGAVAVGFLLTDRPAVLAVALLAATASRVALVPLLIMMMMDHTDIGPARIAAGTGLFFATAQIGGVAGPAATGALADLSDGFRLPLTVHSGVMLVVAAIVGFGYRRALR